MIRHIILLSFTVGIFFQSFGQCNVLTTGVAGPTLTCTGGTTYRSGVAYNPQFDILYSVNSGSSAYSMETFDATGSPLASIAQGFDFRGLWWNSNTNQLEGNGYNSLGIFVEDLNGADGYPLGTGNTVISGMIQPATHSCGQYDPVNDEIIYYNSGSIYRYDRPSGTANGSIAVTGLPVSTTNLNSTSLGYTGCAGKEVALYDYTNQRVYLVDLSTGAYVATCQLPGSAPVPTNQRMSYAMDLFWIFNEGTLTWHSYQIFDGNCNTTNTITPVVCDSYTSPSGNYTWTMSGSYMDTIPNASGCDSIISINLTVNTVDNGVTQVAETLTADQSGGLYQWLDCDNNYAIINGETNQSYTPAVTGNYAVEVTMNGCADTSACFFVDYTGLEELTKEKKELVKIIDFMGRETTFKPNVPLIFIYSDGTIERVMEIKD